MSARTMVVVGASLAGLRAAETFRNEGFDGRVVMVGREAHLPYDRPPLSKALLAGDWEPDRIQLRKPDQLAQLGLEFHLGVAARRLDVDARRLVLADGHELAFDGCVVATGASPRRLPDQPVGWAGLHELRTLDDALTLRSDLHGGDDRAVDDRRRVVVIGAGFIGSEVAATARKLGHHVTVLEALPAPLMRGLGEEMGRAVGAVHAANGVDLRCGVTVAGFEGAGPDDARRVAGVRLGDGSVVPADVVVVGVGVAPDTAWLEGSGLTLDNGIVCDAGLRAAPAVYAAGDVARWPYGGDGPLTRIEHWSNANEQGAHAATNLLAELDGRAAVPFRTLPFVWSDQYDRRIQVIGRVSGDHEIVVVHGSVGDGSFVALYGAGGALMGALAVNQPKKLAGYRKLLAADATWDDALAHARTVEAAG